MELNDIERLIQHGEGLKIEFKESADAVPKSFHETVVNFSNTDGGTIALSTAEWEARLLHLVPSWHQKGTQLAPLNRPENQRHTKEEIEKVPNWRQKGTELLSKKAQYLISILTMASEPLKMSEMMAALDYKNQKTFRDNYLVPLRQAGFTAFTNPEKPTDPENKYRITEAGKIFLGGMI